LERKDWGGQKEYKKNNEKNVQRPAAEEAWCYELTTSGGGWQETGGLTKGGEREKGARS